MQSILCSSNIVGTEMGEWDKCPNLIERANFESPEVVAERFQIYAGNLFAHGNIDCPLQRNEPSDSHCEAVCDSGSCYSRHCGLIPYTPTLVGEADIKGDGHRATCADRSSNVPEVLLGPGRLRDDCPHASQSDERYSEEQPNRGQMSDLPRAFHDSPVSDFGAIVAWPSEAA